MSHLKFSNFAKKRKVPATIHTYIFITLCLCECVCVCGAASWSRRGRFMCLWVLPGHQVACAVANSPRCETQCVCVFVCDSVQKWPSLRINHYEKPNKKGATNRGETETVKKPHAHTVTTDTLTLLFEFCNKCWTWQMKYLTPHKLRAPLSVFSCVRIIIVEF